jgi:hypothetical protein
MNQEMKWPQKSAKQEKNKKYSRGAAQNAERKESNRCRRHMIEDFLDDFSPRAPRLRVRSDLLVFDVLSFLRPLLFEFRTARLN